MRWLVLAAVVVAALATAAFVWRAFGQEPGTPMSGQIDRLPTPTATVRAATSTATAAPARVTPAAFRPRVEVVATGLDIPWSLAFAPDGRLFFTERPGRIRLIQDDELVPEPLAVIEVAAQRGVESGLMGLALDPEFPAAPYLYVKYTYRSDDGLVNRVSRFTLAGNQAVDERVLLDGIPGHAIHDGGRLAFGPDGSLFITTGDASDINLSQDAESLAGKVLRINRDGTVPADNPFPGSPVYSLGHRNPQGLAFAPSSDRLFSTEHGPGANDEVNIIEAGGNYGWPLAQGIAGDPRFIDAIAAFSPPIAPSGATFYRGDLLHEWTGDFFFATLRGSHLHRLRFGGPDGREVIDQELLFEGEYGRLRDVVEGPDGYLYFVTNNRDGRGSPRADDDRLLRIVPE